MSLLNKFLPKKEIKEYFLTLGIEENKIQAAVAQIDQKKIFIIGVGESDFSTGENETEAVDIAISTAEKNLPNDVLVEKVIFALPQYYLENDTVKPDYLIRLKKIAKELSLKPHGFIEYSQALSFYLEKEEGSPPTLLLVAISRNHLIFSLIRVGEIQQTIIVTRSSQITSDFEEAIAKLNAEILPSRIILYDESEKLEQIREELLCLPWHKYTSFLHTPKIEIFPSNRIITAVIEAGASSLLKKLDLVENTETISSSQTTETRETEKNLDKKENILTDETFGFVNPEEITKQETQSGKNLNKLPRPLQQDITSKPVISSSFPRKLISFIRLPKFSVFSLPSLPNIQIIFLLISILALSTASFFALVWFYPKTTISVIVYPIISTQQTEVTLTTDSTKVEPSKNIILAKSLSEEVSGEKKIQTTGKTKIGEKAKGELTLYNKTLASKTFPKGTTMQNGSLKFNLDQEVTVASASDTGEGLAFGRNTVGITASAIGPESNLPSGASFIFKDFPESSYSAKNNQALSGGTSRDVSSVSEEDREKLENDLTNDLLGKAKQQIVSKISPGEKLLDSSIEKKVINKKFSSPQGTEAKDLSLSLSLKINVFSFNEAELSDLVKNRLNAPPNGFSLDNQKIGVKIEEVKTDKSGNYQVKASITAYFLPNIDTEKIKRTIIGKTYPQAVSYLASTENIAGVKITPENELFFLKERIPFLGQNININVITY